MSERMSSQKKLTLALITIVVCVLVAWAAKWILHARSQSAATGCPVYLRQIDSAKQWWALEYNKTTNDIPTWDDIRPGLDPHPGKNLPFELPRCPAGGVYEIGRLDERPSCSLCERVITNQPSCLVNLRFIDGAKDQWALERNRSTNAVPTWDDIYPYLYPHIKPGEKYPRLDCPKRGTYDIGRAFGTATCSIGGPEHTLLRP